MNEPTTAGEHHLLALTREGALYAWGRLDIFQLRLEMAHLPAEAMPVDAPRYLTVQMQIPDIPPMVSAACGTHHNIAISMAGEPYTWGCGESWQIRLGPGAGDVERPTKMRIRLRGGSRCLWEGQGDSL
jgi:regulator of chromosome condensation